MTTNVTIVVRLHIPWAGLLLVLSPPLTCADESPQRVDAPYFGIRVIDEETGRGVPLVELRTVNELWYVTDSSGWVAFHEPDLMNREVFFHVRSPGYEIAKDGFGIRGVRLRPAAGEVATIKIKRTNIAERLYRVTGEGIYRDSRLLGIQPPLELPQRAAGVLGQDSVQAVPFQGRIFWLWGDTNVANYPLGNFKSTCATSPMPGEKTFRPADGVPLDYFMDSKRTQRVRAMAPLKEPGVVWLFGLLTVEDPDGKPALVAHYSRRKSLAEELEHGLMRFDDEAGIFCKIKTLDIHERWRFPQHTAVRVSEEDDEYFYFAWPWANTRVPAQWDCVIDPSMYEALAFDAEDRKYRWQSEHPPTTQEEETRLIAAGKLPQAQTRYQLVEAGSDAKIRLHGASINWNAFRQKWVMIGLQIQGRASFLGEIWYAEAEHPSGPWGKAVKIASHPNYSFYNPRQHVFFDEDGGRKIYFEGTYTHTFSGNNRPTPRYDYNQLMYRLDLADERIQQAFGKPQ